MDPIHVWNRWTVSGKALGFCSRRSLDFDFPSPEALGKRIGNRKTKNCSALSP